MATSDKCKTNHVRVTVEFVVLLSLSSMNWSPQRHWYNTSSARTLLKFAAEMGTRVYDCCTFLQVSSCTTKDSTFYFRLALERLDLNMSWNYCFCSERLETRLGIASQRDGA